MQERNVAGADSPEPAPVDTSRGRRRRIVIVGGERGSGKSFACASAVRLLAGRGIRCRGILCDTERDRGGIPMLVVARDLESDACRTLARRIVGKPQGSADLFRASDAGGDVRGMSPGAAAGTPVAPFRFDEGTFAWANGILRRAAEKNEGPVFLDEVGPVEMEGGTGYYPFMRWYRHHGCCPLAIVARSSLLRSIELWLAESGDGGEIVHVPVRAESRDSAPEAIVRAFEPATCAP